MICTARTTLALTLTLSLCACGDDSIGATGESATETETETATTGEASETGSTGEGTSTTGDETEGTTTEDETTTGEPPEFPPAGEPGPYGVGYRTLDVTYTPEGFTEPRTIEVSLWYPTEDASGDATVYLDLITREDVYLDATAVAGPHPVLAFSHGNGGVAEQSYFLTEHFASHGWVVAAPDHTGNTITDFDEALLADMVVLRPLDMSAMLDEVYSLPASDPLAGQLGDELAVTGHSFGGYTTLALAGGQIDVDSLVSECEDDPMGIACPSLTPERIDQLEAGFADPRVDVAVPLTPGVVLLFGEAGLAKIDAPTMLMTSVLDETTPDELDGDPAWKGLDGDTDVRVEFLTGGHYTFSVACELGIVEGDGCGDDFISPDEAYGIINTYALAFVRDSLWGDPSVSELLDGSEVLSDEVELSAK